MTVLVVTEFHVEPPGAERTKICTNCSCHMAIISAVPINDKNSLNIFFLDTMDQWPCNF